MSRPVKIDLGGTPFTLRTDESEEHVRACAAMVNERLAGLRSRGAPDATIGLLTAMTIADDMLKERAQYKAAMQGARDHLEKLRKAAS